MLRFSQPVLHRKKHKAPCKKYKPYILKYKALISKYMPCIFLSSQIFNVQQHTRGVQNALKILKKRIRYKTYYSCFVAYGKTN